MQEKNALFQFLVQKYPLLTYALLVAAGMLSSYKNVLEKKRDDAQKYWQFQKYENLANSLQKNPLVTIAYTIEGVTAIIGLFISFHLFYCEAGIGSI